MRVTAIVAPPPPRIPDFDLDFYTEAQDLHRLTALIRDQSGLTESDAPDSLLPPPARHHRRRRFMERFARLNDKLVEIITDHSLVSFIPMSLKVRDMIPESCRCHGPLPQRGVHCRTLRVCWALFDS